MGDFNINLLNTDSHQHTNEFFNLMTSNSFYPLISKPTRITSNSATLIDNIFSNNLELSMISGILYSDLSDHLPIFQVTQLKVPTNPVPYKRQIRIINNTNTSEFKSKISKIDWSYLYNFNSTNNCYNTFSNVLISIYNESFPLKTVNFTVDNLSKPWFSDGLANSCRRKNSLYKQYIINPTPFNKLNYQKYRNKYYSLIKIARKKYFHDKLSRVSSNLKQTWNVIKQVISKSQTNHHIHTIKDSQGTYSDPLQIANKFNNYFTSIGPLLAKKVPNLKTSHLHFLTGSYPNNFFLTPTSPSEISSIVCSLSPSRSEGHDGLCITPVKEVIDCLSHPLAYLCNLSFSTGVFPDSLKIAKVIPIFKTDDPSNFSNYRPISILSCLSKILEKLVHSRLSKFLTKFEILNHQQYGFRQHHSTYMAVLDLVSKIFQGFEKNEFTIGIFVDLKKAFDTVDHSVLIDKLDFYGIRGIPLAWFASYLSNRKQFVQIDTISSITQPIKCGVPQGSVLGPLLFILYINDLFHSSSFLSFILFADDTNIFFSHKDINTLFDTVNTELNTVSSWFNANKLTLHPDKTKFILFFPPRKKISETNIRISINGNNISRVSNTKFLGVIINENLCWKPHITSICSKASKIIGIFCKARQLLSSLTLLTLYNSLFLPYLTYCNLIWASTYTSHSKPLFLLQKKAVRIISFAPPRSHTKPFFLKFNILPLLSIYKYQISCFVFSHINKCLPSSLSSLLQFNFELHDHLTRSRFNLHKINLKYQFSICSQAPAIWNNIPLSIRNTLNTSNFKSKLKLHFLNEYKPS